MFREVTEAVLAFLTIAALMVVCHHTIISIIYYHKVDSPFFYSLGILGKYGVDLFFLLCGFINKLLK